MTKRVLPPMFAAMNTEDHGKTQKSFDDAIARAKHISKDRECEVYVLYDWDYFRFWCLTEHDINIDDEVFFTIYPD